MAEYFTHFSVLLPLHTSENVQRAIEIADNRGPLLWHHEYDANRRDGEQQDGLYLNPGFEVGADDNDPTTLWIRDSDSYGEVSNLIDFVLYLAKTMNLSGKWGFVYSCSCSKPLLDGFDGGAHVLDLGKRETVAWVNANEWLMNELTPSPSILQSQQIES